MSSPNSILQNYPFLSCVKFNDVEYVGIIINYDDTLVTIYDIAVIKTNEIKKLFLEMGEIWWWESNRKIPINIFLKSDMIPFRPYIKTFNSKDVELVFGHAVNLSNVAEKRIKRKIIQLVRIPKNTRN
jgi:hypothetical protein